MIIQCLAVTFLATLAVASLCRQRTSILYIVDPPSSRSLHQHETSRSGGVAIYVGIATGTLIAGWHGLLPQWLLIPALGASGVAAISFLDDIGDVFFGYRLSIHLYAAGLLLLTPLVPTTLHLPLLDIPLSSTVAACLVIVSTTWMLNLYNFMDGMDGFAASMTVVGFATLGAIGWLEGAIGYAITNGIIAVAAAAFLCDNRPPARLFMGDTGACLLGYVAIGSILWGDHLGTVPHWVGMLIFLPFIADATVTLAGRIVRFEKIWVGQRNHYYHKLLLRLGHRRTLTLELIPIIGCSVSALLVYKATPTIQAIVLAGWILLYGMAFITIDAFARRREILSEMQR